MYKENEILEVLGDIKNGKDIRIPKGARVRFIKAFGSGPGSLVQVEFEEKVYTLKELSVKPTETDPLAVLKEINSVLIKNNPSLGIYHHNILIRIIYKIKAFFTGLFKKKTEPKKEKHINEIKKIMSEDNMLDMED